MMGIRASGFLALVAGLLFFATAATAQDPAGAGATVPKRTSAPNLTVPVPPGTRYIPPTHAQKFHDYFMDSFGPYAILKAGFSAGVLQADNSPPEWKQGAEAFGRRFGSEYGQTAISQTVRYGGAEILGQDTRFYRCDCRGFFHRLGYAVFSTITARSGADGHRVFAPFSLGAPYAGTMTSLAWYPDRYGPKDAFRFGNYSLAADAGLNVVKEFIWERF